MDIYSDRIASIYRATCKPTQKSYIGYTTQPVYARIRQHGADSFRNPINKFYKAINEHGWINFHWDIIYQSKDVEHCLNVMEPLFIKQYDTMHSGYNTLSGGDLSAVMRNSEYKAMKRKNAMR